MLHTRALASTAHDVVDGNGQGTRLRTELSALLALDVAEQLIGGGAGVAVTKIQKI